MLTTGPPMPDSSSTVSADSEGTELDDRVRCAHEVEASGVSNQAPLRSWGLQLLPVCVAALAASAAAISAVAAAWVTSAGKWEQALKAVDANREETNFRFVEEINLLKQQIMNLTYLQAQLLQQYEEDQNMRRTANFHACSYHESVGIYETELFPVPYYKANAYWKSTIVGATCSATISGGSVTSWKLLRTMSADNILQYRCRCDFSRKGGSGLCHIHVWYCPN